MAGSVRIAVERIRGAHALAVAVFQPTGRATQARISEQDALFACYPEGETLRMILNENAVWRNWKSFPNESLRFDEGMRKELQAVAVAFAPMGLDAVKSLSLIHI